MQNSGYSKVVTFYRFSTGQVVLILGAILLVALVLRLVFFSGYGLGDDPNYFSAFKSIHDGRLDMATDMYHHRFSFWGPLLLIWKMFGISEFTFLLPILLSSLGCIVMVYLIGKELITMWMGLLAATLMAFHPFEVLNATLMSTDVNLSFYMLLSIYFFILGQRRKKSLFFFASGLFVFLAFVNKPFGIYTLPVLFIFFLNGHRLKWNLFGIVLKRYWAIFLTLITLFGGLFGICWSLWGDPLLYLSIYSKENWGVMDSFQLSVYPKQMFLKNEFGEMLHGIHFYLVALCLILIRKRHWKNVRVLLFWFLLLFAFLEFMPHRITDGVPLTAQRLFRYFVIVVPPSILLLAFFAHRFKHKFPHLFWPLFVGYLVFSIASIEDASRVARTAFGEVREVAQFVDGLAEVDVYADWYFLAHLEKMENEGKFSRKWHPWTLVESPEAWEEKFREVSHGLVVTGGPRLPYYGCNACIPNLSNFVPPSHWTLLKEFDKTLHPPWKTEPMRLWFVNKP